MDWLSYLLLLLLSYITVIDSYSIDIDIFKRANVVYECTLLNAFPVTLGEIALTNEPGVVELTVGIEYDNWRSSHFAVNPSTRNARAVGTLINTINNIVN